MIAINADYTTDFKSTQPEVVVVSILITMAHTRHRSPYSPQPDCCCCVPPFLTTTSLALSLSPSPPRITTERFYGRRTGRRASVHRPTRLLCVCLSVFGNIIAIDADYTTYFKFHPTSLSIGTGMSEQILWTKVRLFRDSNTVDSRYLEIEGTL